MKLRRRTGFTLAECMLAMLFISIAFFAYVSLHIRLIDSNAKLEKRENYKEAVSSSITQQLLGYRVTGGAATNTTTNTTNNSTYPGNGTYPGAGSGTINANGSMVYVDVTLTEKPTGLPPNLAYAQASTSWDDKNGHQTLFVDSYERKALTRWY